MKFKLLILGALACGLLASCSKDDENEQGGGNSNGNEGDRYISFNIVSPPSGPGTRGSSEEFENGVGFENEAEKALFLFFDANGKSTQSPQMVEELKWKTTPDNNNHDKCSEATAVIAGNTAPTQVIVILNPPVNYSFVNGQTLQNVRSRINNYNLTGKDEARRIIMSNSVYVKDNKEVCAVDINDKTYPTKEEAEKKPVNIYVERVLAKVRTTYSPTGDNFAQGTAITIDGEKLTLTPKIQGIEIANIAKQAKLIKSIEGWDTEKWSATWDKWNDPDNNRSYWANTDKSNIGFNNKAWSAIDDDIETPNTYYIHPNTQAGTKTSVLITAILENDKGEAQDFIYWAGTYYRIGDDPAGTFTKDTPYKGFLNQYATNLRNEGFRLVHTDESQHAQVLTDIQATDLRWLTDDEHTALTALTDSEKRFHEYEYTALLHATELEKDYSIVKLNGKNVDGQPNYDTYTDLSKGIAAVNDFLKGKSNRVWYWKEGKCYYFAEIEHFGPKSEDGVTPPYDFSVGVVRNHIYSLTLQSVKGLGTPVFDPDVDIIPEKPSDDLFYLAAQIHILKWRLVEQEVNFE